MPARKPSATALTTRCWTGDSLATSSASRRTSPSSIGVAAARMLVLLLRAVPVAGSPWMSATAAPVLTAFSNPTPVPWRPVDVLK
jgi:hypothetical protein